MIHVLAELLEGRCHMISIFCFKIRARQESHIAIINWGTKHPASVLGFPQAVIVANFYRACLINQGSPTLKNDTLDYTMSKFKRKLISVNLFTYFVNGGWKTNVSPKLS